MNDRLLEYLAYVCGIAGVVASAAIEFAPLNVGVSPIEAGVAGAVAMAGLLGLSLGMRT